MTQEINLDQIKFDRHNANKGSVRGRGQIEASLREFGFADAGTLDKNNTIIGGNKRTEVAGEIGMDEAIIVDVDGTKPVFIRRKDLDLNSTEDDRARRLAYALNRSQEVSLTWDAEVLLEDLQSGVDLKGLFDQEELDALLDGLIEKEPMQPAEAQTDKAAELQKLWGTSLGQIWQLGKHRLACGDCTDKATVERLMQGEKAVLMVTDPPYAVNYDPQWRVGLGGGGKQDFANGGIIENDDSLSWFPGLIIPDIDVLYIWTADKTIKDLLFFLEANKYNLAYMIIWNKDLSVFGRGDYHWRYEPCLYMVKKGKPHNWQGDRKQENVWDISTIHSFKNGKDSDEWGLVGHGNQKPLECMSRPIRNNSSEGDIIYEPFAGSGTTLIACEQLSRQCRAVEISPAYCAVILQRYKDSTGQTPVLIDG